MIHLSCVLHSHLPVNILYNFQKFSIFRLGWRPKIELKVRAARLVHTRPAHRTAQQPGTSPSRRSRHPTGANCPGTCLYATARRTALPQTFPVSLVDTTNAVHKLSTHLPTEVPLYSIAAVLYWLDEDFFVPGARKDVLLRLGERTTPYAQLHGQ